MTDGPGQKGLGNSERQNGQESAGSLANMFLGHNLSEIRQEEAVLMQSSLRQSSWEKLSSAQ